MKKIISFLFFLKSILLWSQIGLPIQQSNIPKNHLVVNYDFSKVASFSGTGAAVNNIASSLTESATLVNSPIFNESLGFISFNGTDQHLITPNLKPYFKSVNSGNQESHTLSLWIYPINNSGVIVNELGQSTINTGWRDTHIEMVNGYVKYRVWPGTTTITSVNTLTLNQWHHIAMVYDGTNLKGYVDGVLQGTANYVRQSPANLYYAIATSETVTNMGSGAYGKFNLAKFKMYNIPLNDTDIAQDYNSEKSNYQYSIHSPITNTNPTYWNRSSVWAGDTFNMPHYSPWLNSSLGWAAAANDANQFITLNYNEPVIISGIVTQGRANNGGQYVTSAHVDVSIDGITWTRILTNVTLNNNSIDDVTVLFPNDVFAKYVKVIPITWINHITLRLGILIKTNNIIENGLVINLDPGNLNCYNGTGTTVKNLVVNGTNGAMNTSMATNFSTSNGGLFYLDGDQDYIDFGKTPVNFPTGDISVFFWIKASSFRNGWNIFFSKWFQDVIGTGGYNDMHYAIYPNGSSYYQNLYTTNASNMFGSIALTTNTWYYIGFTIASGNMQMYLNATADGPVRTSSGRTNYPQSSLWLGDARSGGLIEFNGYMGSSQIYNRAISAQEVFQNYNATKQKYGL